MDILLLVFLILFVPVIFHIGCLQIDKHFHVTHHNGAEAQSLSTRRFLGIIESDEYWNKAVENLKKYCNNDVKAMVAVVYFVRDIIDKKLDFKPKDIKKIN